MSQWDNYMLPEDDGLPMRDAHPYVHYKLAAIRHYLTMFNTAMRNKWPNRWYIDLQSGPGKNRIGNEVALGSPLVALTAPHQATHFIFNEIDPTYNAALTARVGASPFNDRVVVYQRDMNELVGEICAQIVAQDKRGQTLNVAFLDPNGIELQWATVEQLARMKKMDLIINFSTGILRRRIGLQEFDSIDRFFGTPEWHTVYERNRRSPMRALIDFYRERLGRFGYKIIVDPLGGHDIPVKNSRNVHIYSLISAGKHELVDKFWKAASSATQPKLPGLDK